MTRTDSILLTCLCAILLAALAGTLSRCAHGTLADAPVEVTTLDSVPLFLITPQPKTIAELAVGAKTCTFLGYWVSIERHIWINRDAELVAMSASDCRSRWVLLTRTQTGFVAHIGKQVEHPRGLSDSDYMRRGYVQAEIEVDAAEARP